MKRAFKSLIALLILLLSLFPASAKVTLPAFFTDNMLIQQNSTLTLNGKARPNRKVTALATWDKQKYEVKSNADGTFQLVIPTPAAGGPHALTISDGDKLILKNILVGEVWFCAGQSNMQMEMYAILNSEQEIAQAQDPSIRLLQVQRTVKNTPASDVEMRNGGWQECNPGTVRNFSAVAYFYARALRQQLNVPVGVIDCTWGGTPAEAWMSGETLAKVDGFQEKLAKMQALGFDKQRLMTAYQEETEAWKEAYMNSDAGYKNGIPAWTTTMQSGGNWKEMELPGAWEYRGLPHFDGVVWFQREIDIPAAWQGKEVQLHLGKIDDEDITWFNGQEIARGHGYATHRHYTIPATLAKAGKGVLTVRVVDFSGDGGINGSPEELYAEVDGQRIELSGKWNWHIGVSQADIPVQPLSPDHPKYPSALYNGMVSPFTSFPIKGAIWYQGEENSNRARQYIPLFQSLIHDWRKQWKNDFPFYFVQLAGYMTPRQVQPDSQWAYLREAQAEALHVANTGMVTAIDLGDPYDIHPKNKQDVGKRLAMLALANTYGIGSYRTPICLGHQVSGRTLTLTFDTVVQVAGGGEVKGFILAGSDGVFHSAKATIQKDGKHVVLESPQVEMPVAARYNWADCPDGNLYSPKGEPAGAFRTDRY